MILEFEEMSLFLFQKSTYSSLQTIHTAENKRGAWKIWQKDKRRALNTQEEDNFTLLKYGSEEKGS